MISDFFHQHSIWTTPPPLPARTTAAATKRWMANVQMARALSQPFRYLFFHLGLCVCVCVCTEDCLLSNAANETSHCANSVYIGTLDKVFFCFFFFHPPPPACHRLPAFFSSSFFCIARRRRGDCCVVEWVDGLAWLESGWFASGRDGRVVGVGKRGHHPLTQFVGGPVCTPPNGLCSAEHCSRCLHFSCSLSLRCPPASQHTNKLS